MKTKKDNKEFLRTFWGLKPKRSFKEHHNPWVYLIEKLRYIITFAFLPFFSSLVPCLFSFVITWFQCGNMICTISQSYELLSFFFLFFLNVFKKSSIAILYILSLLNPLQGSTTITKCIYICFVCLFFIRILNF